MFVASRVCFDVEDGRKAVSIARHLLRDDDDLVAYTQASGQRWAETTKVVGLRSIET